MMQYFLVKVDQFIGGYPPIETIHLLCVLDGDLRGDLEELLKGLWINPSDSTHNCVEFFNGEITCETTDVKEIDEQTLDLLKGLGL